MAVGGNICRHFIGGELMEVLLFYGATKRDNSTKVPTGGVSYFGTLKDECDMLSPSILFDMGNDNPTHYTMAYIPDFGRYYFCDWTFRGSRHWWCNMSVDVLASWKSSIGVSDLYVLRSAQEQNFELPDTKYPMSLVANYRNVAISSGFPAYTGGGTYIIAVVGGNNGASAANGVTYYAVTTQALRYLMNRMYNNNGLTDDWTQLFEKKLSEDTIPLKLFVDPAQYIMGCIWLPFNNIDYYQAANIKFGYFESDVAGLVLITNHHRWEWNIPYLSLIPNNADTELWKYYSPYSEYELYLPAFGSMPIDAATLIGNTSRSLKIKGEVSIYTGEATVCVYAASGAYSECLIGKLSCNLGIPFMIGGAKADVTGMAHSAVNLTADVANIAHDVTHLEVSDVTKGGQKMINNVSKSANDGIDLIAKTYTPKVSTSGTQGGASDLNSPIQLVRRFFEPADQDPTHYGYPLCKVKRINTLAGFIKVADGDVECSATSTEKTMIRRYLESGFYYE